MKNQTILMITISGLLLWAASGGLAEKAPQGEDRQRPGRLISGHAGDRPTGADRWSDHAGDGISRVDRWPDAGSLFMAASPDTYLLAEFTFDGPGGGADPQGWIPVDQTEELDLFWHVDDFAGLGGGDFGRLTPLEGSRSMWCGTRPDSSAPWCYYATLPGYGNNWEQYFESVYFPVAGDVEITFKIRWDNEASNDFCYVQYVDSGGDWHWFEDFNWIGEATIIDTIPAELLPDSLKIRFDCWADGIYSDEDGYWNSDGAIILDSLVIRDSTGIIDYQDFESEPLGATQTLDGHWRASTYPAYGNYAGLFHGSNVLQENPCNINLSHVWGFFNGSTDTYAWNGHPEQQAVPHGRYGACNAWTGDEKDFIKNEIWSPHIDLSADIWGTTVPAAASQTVLEFDVYRDLPIENVLYYTWQVRSVISDCGGHWYNWSRVYWGIEKNWVVHREDVSSVIDPAAEGIQLGLGCWDMCYTWCGYFGDCHPHSHSPLFDNVRVMRIDTRGPIWDVAERNLFQDNFPGDGTVTGTVKIDAAIDLAADDNPVPIPGDSLCVGVSGSHHGLDTDPVYGGKAVYIHVRDISPAKSGSAVSGRTNRWPVVADGGGTGWTVLKMDNAYEYGSPLENRFCVDLNDTLYTPGDTIYYYLSARDTMGHTSYFSQPIGVTLEQTEAEASPMEVTCLPANGLAGTTDVLFVNDAGNPDCQNFFAYAFRALGIQPDRYDVLAPAWREGNGPGARVNSVANQLIPYYDKVVWSTGTQKIGTIGDGVNDKSDDFAMLLAFVDQHANPVRSGVYLSGDHLAEEWSSLGGTSAQNLKTFYLPHSLVSGDHASGHGNSPLAVGAASGMFDIPVNGPDTVVAFGGCPDRRAFDQVQPLGSASLEMTYSGTGLAADGAVISFDSTNGLGNPVGVVLSGFGFEAVRDDRARGLPAWAVHLNHILNWLGDPLLDLVGVPDLSAGRNHLAQNYPNPFNPATTIRYEIRQTGRVSLKVYDVAGRLIATLVDEVQAPRSGGYNVQWPGLNNDGQPVSSGVYFYRLLTGEFTAVKKMVLLK